MNEERLSAVLVAIAIAMVLISLANVALALRVNQVENLAKLALSTCTAATK